MGHVAAFGSIDDEPRIVRLHTLNVLDTGRELLFDRFVFTVAQLLRVPIAIISLADKERHWFKAQVGLPMHELPRNLALCERLLAGGDSLIYEDLSLDAAFADHPMVIGPPYLRFFAAVPLLTSDGLCIGSLCVADRSAKTLLGRQIEQLRSLARNVSLALEARRHPDL